MDPVEGLETVPSDSTVGCVRVVWVDKGSRGVLWAALFGVG